MSNFATRRQDPPRPNQNVPVVDLVIGEVYWKTLDAAVPPWVGGAVAADLRERASLGNRKYGTPLQACNGRDAPAGRQRAGRPGRRLSGGLGPGPVYLRQRLEELLTVYTVTVDRGIQVAEEMHTVRGLYDDSARLLLRTRVLLDYVQGEKG